MNNQSYRVDIDDPTVEPYEVTNEKTNGDVKAAAGSSYGEDGYEASVEISKTATVVATAPYAGMGKEDLLRFSETPFWNRLRTICLALFWACWLALLAAAIGLTIVFPRCKPAPTQDWWQTSVMYQIYVRSFYDSNGDGIGDLNGVTEKLDYLANLKVDAIVLSSIYQTQPSANNSVDYGYEITNYTDINPDYGDLEDLRNLISSAHAKHIKVLMEFVPNHTGDKHPWFVESATSSDHTTNPYWNYYVWVACSGTSCTYPTNWLSVHGNSSWTNGSTRAQYYYHQFSASQPDLNLRSTAVRNELDAVLRFWLNLGVDGFRVNSAAYLFEDDDLRNEPQVPCGDSTNQSYDCLSHIYTTSQPETQELIARWRAILNEFTNKTSGQQRVLLTDAMVSIQDSMPYYGNTNGDGAHMPFNFELTKVNDSCGGKCISDLVDSWYYNMPWYATATWLIGTQDTSRLAGIVGSNYTSLLRMLQLTLPGVAITYYGEEIDMVNGNNPLPGAYRTPMQWSNGTSGGFMNDTDVNNPAMPWLPLNPDYETKNVQVLNQSASSGLRLYQTLAALHRTDNGLRYGDMNIAVVDQNIFSYLREYDGTNRYLVVLNFGTSSSVVNFPANNYMIPSSAQVVATSSDSVSVQVGNDADLTKLHLNPGDGIVLMWPYSR